MTPDVHLASLCNLESGGEDLMARGASFLAVWIVVATAAQATADILVGPFTFKDLAFADDATQIDAGTIFLIGGAADLDDALTGFSPTKGIAGTGSSGNANHFQLDFTDLLAVNAAGDDLVFFDARFSEDPYEIAVREVGSGFTSFLSFLVTDFVDTGEFGPNFSSLFALPIELDDFGLAAGTVVDAIQFRALENSSEVIDGDPVMAAVLNTVPEPSTLLLAFTAFLLALSCHRRRRSSV